MILPIAFRYGIVAVGYHHRAVIVPRHPRLFLPNFPLHIVHRGHNRNAVFSARSDYEYYLKNLHEQRDKLSIKLYAYCLMTNHVHLIVSPGANAHNISKLMKVLGARQTRYVNRLESGTGTIWEGRFKASLIDSDSYLLSCYRYVDLNPVRAAIVESPDLYEWSSYRYLVRAGQDNPVDQSTTFQSLGNSPVDRATQYRDFVAKGIGDAEVDLIRSALQRNQLTGKAKFEEEIAERTGRRVLNRGQGRPGKKK